MAPLNIACSAGRRRCSAGGAAIAPVFVHRLGVGDGEGRMGISQIGTQKPEVRTRERRRRRRRRRRRPRPAAAARARSRTAADASAPRRSS